MGDNVNHPNHYQNIAGVEAIDILNDVVKDLPGTQAAMLWNTLKYLLRFQKKNGLEDLKKAQNYLQWLIDEINSSKDIQEKQTDMLLEWLTDEINSSKDLQEKHTDMLLDTWHSDEYGEMRIFARSSNPNGIPSKLSFDLKSAEEKFKNIFYRMILSDWYGEFSIADIALDMKFKVPKCNKWNIPVKWESVINRLSTEIIIGKYELIFNRKLKEDK